MSTPSRLAENPKRDAPPGALPLATCVSPAGRTCRSGQDASGTVPPWKGATVMATLRMNPPGPLDHARLLAGAVRLAMALGATYHDVHGRFLASEYEVLEALARDGSVTSARKGVLEPA